MSQGRKGFTYRDELALVTFLTGDLERQLAGRHQSRVLRTIPSDHCHLGVLGPRDPHVDDPEPLDVETEASASAAPAVPRAPAAAPTVEPATADTGDDDTQRGDVEQLTAERQGVARDSTRRPPSSLGFEIVVEPIPGQVIELTVELSFAVYTQHFPTFEEQRLELGSVPAATVPDATAGGTATSPAPAVAQSVQKPQRAVSLIEAFERRTVVVPPIPIRIDAARGRHRLTDQGLVQASLAEVLAVAAADPRVWRASDANAVVPAQALANEQAYHAFLRSYATGGPLLPPLRASLDVRVHPEPDGRVRVRCYLRNDTPRDQLQRYRDQHNILADCAVSGTLVRGHLAPVELIPVPRDYQFDRSVWGIGHGTSVVISEDRRSIRTQSLARFAQPRRTTSKALTIRFADLATDTLVTLERIRLAMLEYADGWERNIIAANALNLSPDQLSRCRDDLQAFRGEEVRFACGIAALAEDPRLLMAFQAMNRAVARAAGGGYDTWHLFQIVFIVTQLTALAVRENITSGAWPPDAAREWGDELEWADVLWFSTGGGKTEAYLGLISCAALYDRLRGKRFGITAWIRFPLRMLSVQQLQRAAKILWETECERRALPGDVSRDSDGISLGYFVGASSTPNQLRTDDAGNEWSFSRLESDPTVRDRLLLVSNCPACSGVGTVQVRPDRAAVRIRHICSRCNTDLPVFVSDDEIYRFLPTVIVGTIDKMAGIAFQAKFGMLWGGAAWRCSESSEHGFGLGDWCVNGCASNPPKGKARQRAQVVPYDPSPTFHVQDELHLLQQELGAFAGHYETLVRSCEAAVGGKPPKTIAATATIEGFEHQIRHVYGVRHARRFPTRGYDLLDTFYTSAELDPESTDGQPQVARMYIAFRPPHLHAADAASLCARLLHERLIACHEQPLDLVAAARLPNARTEEEVRALLHYYSTTLTYVGSKARGVRIQQSLEREAGRLRPANSRDLCTEFLSGDSSLAMIAETVRRVESPPAWSTDGFLDATVATSIISHGVDVERFNLMVMDGIPEETADYIQASSRSGRRHVGLVVAVLAAYSLRASSIYHRFTEYHRHLERLVSPVSINRFAKFAVGRTAPGVFAGVLLGRLGALAHTDQLKTRKVAHEAMNPGEPSRLPASARLSRAEFLEAVEEAYALTSRTYPHGLELGMRQAVREHVERFAYLIAGSRQPKLMDVLQPKPMLSLRDVDVGVQFRPDEALEYRELQWFDAHRN